MLGVDSRSLSCNRLRLKQLLDLSHAQNSMDTKAWINCHMWSIYTLLYFIVNAKLFLMQALKEFKRELSNCALRDMVKLLRTKLAVVFASSFIANAVKSRILDTRHLRLIFCIFSFDQAWCTNVLIVKHHSRSCCVSDFERTELR